MSGGRGGDGGGSSWSDLPADVVADVMNLLEVVDFVRLSSTCVSCRSLWRERTCRPEKKQIPWMMISSPAHPHSRFFYSLPDHKIYNIHLPQIAGLPTLGSSEGFLITVDRFGELQTLNPLTGTELFPLPSPSTHHEIVGVIRDADGQIVEYTREIKTRNGPNHMGLDLEYMQQTYYKKAIISPYLDMIIIIMGGRFQRISFARPGDISWTLLSPLPLTLFCDFIFHKGRLYAIDLSGSIFIFDLDTLEPPFIPSPTRGPLDDESPNLKRFLVESPDGHDLFLVLKELDETDDTGSKGFKTTGFVVFKLDHIKFEWEKVKSIGEVAMFLGHNYSIAYSTHDFPFLKGNAIYFTYDDYFFYFTKPECEGNRDSGVFNLQDGSIQLFCPRDDLQHDWPPPVWFTPILR